MPLTGLQRGEAKAHDDGVGARDADGFGEVVETRREEEILALCELRVEAGGGVAGVGDEELARGMDVPGVDPPCQVMPALLVRSEGTRT